MLKSRCRLPCPSFPHCSPRADTSQKQHLEKRRAQRTEHQAKVQAKREAESDEEWEATQQAVAAWPEWRLTGGASHWLPWKTEEEPEETRWAEAQAQVARWAEAENMKRREAVQAEEAGARKAQTRTLSLGR